jgi:rfaE bifunctional protein kinase chain/domain
MNSARLESITARYSSLRVAIVGDFCLDRYLEIDPSRSEVSIETGLPVHNVVNVRSQPGAAGTILNNLVALGLERIYPIGFAGEDGEGFELGRSLAARRGVSLDYFLKTKLCRTFTYTKPLVIQAGQPPVELNRLDFKNWSPTPTQVRDHLAGAVSDVGARVDAVILLDQVDVADTGVVTGDVLRAVETLARQRPDLLIVADSRRSLKDYPPVSLKMNRAEFGTLTKAGPACDLETLKKLAAAVADQQTRPVFVSLAEHGILGAMPSGQVEIVPALPVRGPIDIVGAGDAVMANLVAALGGGATLREALEMAMLAASLVIHQLGTTGTASIEQLAALSRG